MEANYEIDSIDRTILSFLLKDARTPYLEIARSLGVSGGTIHQRIDKLKASGILIGARAQLNMEQLGLGVTVLIGVHLNGPRQLKNAIDAFTALPEIVEAYYTSGTYGLMIKVHVKDIKDYHRFLTEQLQAIDAVRFTESFICLDQPIDRTVNLDLPLK